ncbi:MAG TPA: hypothetical protein VF945_21460, partial [Polyangia bacterium]
GMPRRRRFALVGSAALIAIASVAFVAVRRSPASHQPPPAIIASTAAPATPRPVAAPPPQPTAAKPPASSAARLTVELDVAAAQIWLDGALVGDGVRRARFAVDRPGRHLLRVLAPHRRAYRRAIFVPAGADLELRVALAHGASPTSNFQKAKVRTTDGDYLVDPFKP